MGKDSAPHRVAVLALPPVVAFDLTIATHVFGHDGEGRYAVTVCSPVAGAVPTTSGFAITVEAGLDALADAETVIVPGFARYEAPFDALADALSALRAAAGRGARVASICTGAFALARAGLLDGRRATTHWGHADALAGEHPRVTVDSGVLYVDEGDVLTSAGLAAGIDLCLHMFARDHGHSAAVRRARNLVTPLHRAGGQAQFTPAVVPAECGELAPVTAWAAANLHLPITVSELARRAVRSPRAFRRLFLARLGMSPHAWLTGQRLRVACTLLESGAIGVNEVARRSGFGTAANLRLHFRRAFGTTPTAYRSAFLG